MAGGGSVAGEAGEAGQSGEEADWAALRVAAQDVMRRAYAPYSSFPVGAAGFAVTPDGVRRVVTGCNVENASYGVGLCAECGLASNLHSTGGGRLVAVSIVGGDGEPLAPCGRCRQVLYEAGGAGLLVETAQGIVPLRDLLPGAFGPEDLLTAAQRH